MKNSITEIVKLITKSFEENFEKIITEKKGIFNAENNRGVCPSIATLYHTHKYR